LEANLAGVEAHLRAHGDDSEESEEVVLELRRILHKESSAIDQV
jgi:hypothetical protein